MVSVMAKFFFVFFVFVTLFVSSLCDLSPMAKTLFPLHFLSILLGMFSIPFFFSTFFATFFYFYFCDRAFGPR